MLISLICYQGYGTFFWCLEESGQIYDDEAIIMRHLIQSIKWDFTAKRSGQVAGHFQATGCFIFNFYSKIQVFDVYLLLSR